MNLTDEQRRRLEGHLERRLREIGVERESPGLPCAGPIKILEQFEWPPVLTMPQREVDGFVCVENLANEDGTYEMHFTGFYLLFDDGMTYARLFRNAIHEGAHVMQWYERMKATRNKFTKEDLEEFRKCSHGVDFSRWDSGLLKRACEIGFRACGLVPDEVSDLLRK